MAKDKKETTGENSHLASVHSGKKSPVKDVVKQPKISENTHLADIHGGKKKVKTKPDQD